MRIFYYWLNCKKSTFPYLKKASTHINWDIQILCSSIYSHIHTHVFPPHLITRFLLISCSTIFCRPGIFDLLRRIDQNLDWEGTLWLEKVGEKGLGGGGQKCSRGRRPPKTPRIYIYTFFMYLHLHFYIIHIHTHFKYWSWQQTEVGERISE